MGDTLICPKCHERLWVGEMQIPLITCPMCLARIVNPNATREPIANEVEQILRRQVIPLEDEVDRDMRETTRWLAGLAVALFAGAIVIATLIGMNIMSVALAIGGLVMAGNILLMRRKSRAVNEPASVYLERVQRDGTTVLDYLSDPHQGNVGSFLGGFVLSIGLSFLALLLIAAARGVGRIVAVIAAIAAIGALVYFGLRASQSPQKGGFFSGVVAGLIVGAMGCGPCALISLG